ncbi:hypothetical protein RIF29_28308 [Crotalaria pallida]|uniref:Uncharacterized protein n=1 Tax=Crotalaria pallida TaxID=3830 RepID=A0AAN9ERG3_CROPI
MCYLDKSILKTVVPLIEVDYLKRRLLACSYRGKPNNVVITERSHFFYSFLLRWSIHLLRNGLLMIWK